MGSSEHTNEYANELEEGRIVTLSQCEKAEATSPTMTTDSGKTMVPSVFSPVQGKRRKITYCTPSCQLIAMAAVRGIRTWPLKIQRCYTGFTSPPKKRKAMIVRKCQ
jgi:hypothetical protein